MNARNLALLVLCAALSGGCGRPRLAAWDACLQSDTAIVTVGQPPSWSIARGPDDVLMVQALWGYPPVVTHRARSGVLQIRLPPGPLTGQRVVLGPGDGIYVEDDQGRVYESSALAGEVEYLLVTVDRARIRLDVRATQPVVDTEGMGEVPFVGEIDADRQPYAKCLDPNR